VGPELLRAEGQTDITKPTVAFRDFPKAPKNLRLSKQNYYNI